MTKEKNSLNKKEKQEIVSDVKKALEKAKNNLKKHNQKTSKSIIISIIIIMIISLGIIYWYFASNPRKLFTSSTDTFFKTIEDNLVLNDNSKGHIDIISNVKTGNKELNKYNYKIDYLTDNNKNYFLWKTYNENKLLSKLTFYNGNNGYLYIPDLHNKYIAFSNNYFNYNYKSSETIITSLNKAFLKAINNYKISKTKTVFKINGKLVNTYKASLTLNNDKLNEVIDKINTYLKDDRAFQDSYNSMFKKEKFETKINGLKDKFKNSNLEINIYTTTLKHSFIRLELIEYTNEILKTFKISKINNKYQITLDDNNNSTNIKYIISTKKNKNKYIYKVHLKKQQNNNIVLDMNTNIKIKKKNNINIPIKDINDLIDYGKLSSEEKIKIDEKLKPIKMLKDSLFIK